MSINKKYLKKLAHQRSKQKQHYSKMDKIIHQMPYHDISEQKLNKDTRHYIKPLAPYYLNQNISQKTDSRVLSFKSLKKNKRGAVAIYGFVGGYRLVFNDFYHRAFMYLLLQHVTGLTYRNKVEYLTDHLWIDINVINALFDYPTVVGIGDFVKVVGKPNIYHGNIGHLRGFKADLSSAGIDFFGYPKIRKGHLRYDNAMMYFHDNRCIFRLCRKYHPHMIPGGQMRKDDIKKLHDTHYTLGASKASHIGHFIHEGFNYKVDKKHNPSLIIENKGNNHRILRWTTQRRLIRHYKRLTTAMDFQDSPKTVEKEIDDRLGLNFKDDIDLEQF